MKIARNHKAAVIHCETPEELEEVAKSLLMLQGMFPLEPVIGDGERAIRVKSLKGFVATVRVGDAEDVET